MWTYKGKELRKHDLEKKAGRSLITWAFIRGSQYLISSSAASSSSCSSSFS